MNLKKMFILSAVTGIFAIVSASECKAQSLYHGPTAVGVVRSSGESVSQIQAIQSHWDAKNRWYEIKISRVNYFWLNFSTVVTPKTEGLTPSTSSVNNRLIVRLTDRNGNRVQGDFSFITYRLKPRIK